MKRIVLVAAAAAMLLNASAAIAETREDKAARLEAEKARKEEEKKLGSLYMRCDGQPNNMTDGESFARFLGAVTLLGIFAKSPESPDPKKRLFAEKGVDACNQLIDGEKAEGNGLRRIPLILARGLHQIEAKNYQAALDDVAKAKAEAATLGLVGNPYFDRSMGLSFGNIEAEALLRMNDPAAAQAASLERTKDIRFSFIPVITADSYGDFNREITPDAERLLDAQGRLIPGMLNNFADRLEEAGRYSEAAVKRETLVTMVEGIGLDEKESIFYARAAISHALAGEWDQARARADFARSNIADRRARGVPEDDASKVVELLDLYDVLRVFNEGSAAQARRSFAARSQWLEPSLGQVMETNRRLREGATEEELFGSLAKTPDQLWQDRRDAAMALKLQQDTDNKSLFTLIWPYAKVNEFEDRSKDTWRVTKSKMMAEKPDEKSGMWRIFSFASRQTAIDSIMLHSALQAKAQGKDGFTITVILADREVYAYGPFTYSSVRFVNRSEVGTEAARYLAADDVIAELSQVIPSPEVLKARKK